jgi:hypothetical protein
MNEKYSIVEDDTEDEYYYAEEEITQQVKDFEQIVKIMSDSSFGYEDACKMLLLKKGVPN